MSTRPDIVREWGRHRRPRRPWLPIWAVAAVVTASVLGALWVRASHVRAHPWLPPSGRPAFASCTYGGRISAWCARLTVPEDPRKPHGRTIGLHIAVLPATKHPPAGALFYLEGGPGVPATQSAVVVNTLFAEVERDRDIVMVDQRGTGGSNRLSCEGSMPASIRRCFARIAHPELYTSTVAAADIEAVRRALGYDGIDVFGGSYGATLAQVYLHLYPASVRTLVLDSGSLTSVRLYDRSARNAQSALDAVLARCGAACASTPRELAAILRSGVHRVATPGKAVTLGPDDVAWTIASLSETPSGAAEIPFAVREAARGDFLPLARVPASDLGPLGGIAAFWEIVCSEPWARFDPAPTPGSYLSHAAAARARMFRLACRSVPKGRVAAAAFAATPASAPVLMLSGSADPNDPPANLRGWERVFPNGRLVVVAGAAHGTMAFDCVQTLVARFVAAGTADGLDASCARHVPLPPFMTG